MVDNCADGTSSDDGSPGDNSEDNLFVGVTIASWYGSWSAVLDKDCCGN